MRGNADRASAIAADAASRAACGNRGSFASARAARGVRQIPRIARFSREQVVSFVGHQKFGSGRIAEEDGACSLQSRNEWSVPFCNVVFAEKRTGGTGPAGDVDAALDAERHALEKADLHALCYQALRCARLPTSAFGVQMDKHIQFRLQLFNTFEVKFNEFDGRDFLGVN